MNIPNLLTLLRVLPFRSSFCCSICRRPGATCPVPCSPWPPPHWLDGYLAGAYAPPFGAFLDPVADKLMVAVALVLLVEEHANLWLTLPAVIIIGREIVVSALREWMAELGARRGSRCPTWASEGRAADAGAGHSPGESAADDLLGDSRLRAADHLRGADLWSMVPTAGRVAASVDHPEINF